MKYIIYGHHCKITNKWYIGQTSQDPSKRWGSNGNKYLYKRDGKFIHNRFANAIMKYGWDSFDHIILEETTEVDADYYEDFYIKKYNSVEDGYNNLYGGNSNKHLSDETKKILSEINIGRKNSPESKKKCSETMKKLYKENKMKNIISLTERNKNFTRRVKCIELNKEYSSLKEAAQDTNIKNPCSISECIKGKHKYAGILNGVKLHWIFIDNGRGK